MGKTFREGHDYPTDFGFTGSAGKSVVRQHIRNPRQQAAVMAAEKAQQPLAAPAVAPQRPKG